MTTIADARRLVTVDNSMAVSNPEWRRIVSGLLAEVERLNSVHPNALLDDDLYGLSAHMLSDAVEIADSCARADIECYCLATECAPHRWYDTSQLDPFEHQPSVEQAVRYLLARGHIQRHPENDAMVRFTA